MIKIYLARHGETTWNAEMRIQGRSDPELTEIGHTQSLALLEQLKDRPLSAIYTSTLRRSVQTAQPIAQHLGLPIEKRPELDEIAFGILEGKKLSDMDESTKSELDRFRQNRLTYRIPGGENYTDVADRVRPLMNEILWKHRGREVLIVGHRGVNRMMIGILLEQPLELAVKVEQANGCLYVIQRNGEPRVFHYLNAEIREGLLFEGQRTVL